MAALRSRACVAAVLLALAATCTAQPFTSSAYGTIVNYNVQQPPFYYNATLGYTDSNGNPTGPNNGYFLSIDQLLCRYTPAPYDPNQVGAGTNTNSKSPGNVNVVPTGTLFQGAGVE